MLRSLVGGAWYHARNNSFPLLVGVHEGGCRIVGRTRDEKRWGGSSEDGW
jgi:hypothetical protein